MNMDQHITKLCQTINWQIRNLYRIRRYVDQETCANIVRAMLLSRLDYCNVLFKKDLVLDRLQRLQNKCARLVFMPPRRAHISFLLKKLHWLRIKDRISFKTLLYVYKSLNGLCPRYIDACLTVKRPREGSVNTSTDHGLNLRVPRSNKYASDRAFSVAAPLKWNTNPIYSSFILKLTFILNLFCLFLLLYCFLCFVSLGKGVLQMPYIIIIINYF